MGINEIYSIFLIVCSVLNALLCLLLFKKKKVKKYVIFIIMSVIIYAMGYAVELLQTQLFYVKGLLYVEYIGVLGITYFWAIYILDTKGILNKKNNGIVFGIRLVTFLLYIAVITNDFHGLYHTNMEMVSVLSFYVVDFDIGPLYIVQFAYKTFVILGGVVTSFFMINKSHGKLKKQYYLILLCSFFCSVALIISVFGREIYYFDIFPLVASPVAAIFGYVVYKYKFINQMPLAYYQVFQQINDPVLVIDNNRLIAGYNKAFSNLVPEINEKHIGVKTLAFRKYKDELREILGHLYNQSTQFDLYSKMLKKHMNIKVSELVEDDQKIGEIYLISEVTKQVEQLNALEKLANYDSLTQILNRRMYFETGKNTINKGELKKEYISAITFDIDDFKTINDQYGHSAGDVVLKGIGRILNEIECEHCIVGRIGGEEFGLIMTEHNIKSAAVFCEKLKRRIAETKYYYNGIELTVTASFGIAEYNRVCDDSFDKMISRSDKAMYKAKINGKNRVEYFRTIDEEKKVSDSFYHLFKG